MPSTFTKDQATQLAGLAVGPIFPWYFLLGGACGLLTVVTALTWFRAQPQIAVHRLRFYLLAAALATVIVGAREQSSNRSAICEMTYSISVVKLPWRSLKRFLR